MIVYNNIVGSHRQHATHSTKVAGAGWAFLQNGLINTSSMYQVDVHCTCMQWIEFSVPALCQVVIGLTRYH